MKVLISDPLAKEGVEVLKKAGFEVDEKTNISHDDLVKDISGYDAIIVRSRTKVRADVLANAQNLKVIGRAGIGLDNIDLDVAKEKGIKVLNTPGATSASVAELAIGLMFALARHIAQASASTTSGKWEKKRFKGNELMGRTLGIIGVGRIGTEVAKRAKSLGMEVIGYDPNVKESEYGRMVDLDTLLSSSDIITLHLPKTEETTHLISKDEIGKMKDGVWLVNCARGGIVDEAALYEGLKSGKVAKAAIDVFEKEPPEGTNLFEFPQVVATPHIGAQAAEGQMRAGVEIAEKVRDALKGQ
ncbi:MAG TPA: 3-phosphoglycerate dehydrogenase [bacterium (Candidatus Stahlbacteria)]|nr:3-phosphoglycerate dehydrogenase [Candidatus Stahlbacteria bacterium]